jgi:glycosyltransferase involved in cell wall biosynthesis
VENNSIVRLLVNCGYGLTGQLVSVPSLVAAMLTRARQAEIPDGLSLEFVAYCSHGSPGDQKVFSYSVARTLLARGVAKLSERQSGIVHKVEPPAPVIKETFPVKVTAICPTYNRRLYIPTTIALFLAQTFTDSELLIVDDSEASVGDIIPAHPRIRYIHLPPSERPEIRGHDGRMLIGAKRNVCCAYARGEYIVHWDDDDWQGPHRIADQVTQLEKVNKQVLTYCNILYWNEATQMACSCFPRKEMRALHGATFCYKKEWWAKHPFAEIGGGEDTRFGTDALRNGQLHISDAGKNMVVRAHGNNDASIVDRGNTCRTGDHMNTPAIPKIRKEEIPVDFFKPLLEPPALPIEDVVIGSIKNYDWPKVRAYAVSLARSGFTGTKLMFVENVPAEVRQNLLGLGFTVVDFVTPPAVRAEEQRDYLTFGRHRFKYAIDYLRQFPGRYRYAVWTDVRDLVFQTNPSTWLENNLDAPYSLVAAGEGWLVKDEPYNDRWTKKISPSDYAWLRELEICCSGTFAGHTAVMLGVFEEIYKLTLASIGVAPDNADQGMFNRIIRTLPYKELTTVPCMSAGFCATWFPAKSNDPKLIPNYGAPVFDWNDGTVYTPTTNAPFCMVHQYDRDAAWTKIVEAKYA